MKITNKVMSAVAVLAVLAMVAMPALAATNDQTLGTSGYAANLASPVIMRGTCDTTVTSGFGTPGAAFDVYKVINVPSNSTVMAVWCYVAQTNSANALSFCVGDSTATNTYMTAVNAATQGRTVSIVGTSTNTVDYPTGGFISVVPTSGAMSNAIVRIQALVVPWVR